VLLFGVVFCLLFYFALFFFGGFNETIFGGGAMCKRDF